MRINIGIVGYGNLGKAVEKQVVSNKDLNLIAIFSRRTILSQFGTPIEPFENIQNFKRKIDIMLLCGGSKNDLLFQTPQVLEHFDCINTFDTHEKIIDEYKKLNEIAKKNQHILIMSCGWDPGLFSIIRATMYAISLNKSTTFWGRGISMGHSDALRNIPNVIDAIEFTVPNKQAKNFAKRGIYKNTSLHERECFVVANEKDATKIEYQIKNIPFYFKNQPTKVSFVSHEKLLKLKSKLFHKGEIIGFFKTNNGLKTNWSFSISMQSNPDFTAQIILAYIKAVINLSNNKMTGCFTPLDIPASFLFDENKKDSVIKEFC